MKSYNQLMSRVDAIIAQQDKSVPVAVGGLLGRTKAPPKQTPTANTPEAQVAKYVAMIRKQREALMK